MIFWPFVWFVIFLLDNNVYGATTSVIEAEHKQLDKNLKILRKDFNKLVENVEDFAEDFLMQVHETGKLMGNTFINDDYNWQDDKDNSILKATKELQESLLPSSTESSPSILSKTLSLPKLNLPKIPNLLTKDDEDSEEISNHIDANRKKRSSNTMIQEFMGRPPIPMEQQEMPMDQPPPPSEVMEQREEQRQHVPPLPPMPEKPRHRQEEQIMQEFPPFTDKTSEVMEGREKPEGPSESHKRVEPGGHSQARQNLPFFSDMKDSDSLICSAKTQKELELEKQKMEKLKEEVKKLNELVSLLKDQQKVMQVLNIEDADIEHNEVFGNLKNDIENTFLYKALKQLDNKQRGGKSFGRHQGMNMRVPIDDLSTPQKTSDSSFEDLQKIKLELRNTEDVLNQTKDALINGKRKEEILEQEIKRQSSELKFLKVMTENLYDKIGLKSGVSSRGLRSSDDEDIDVDSILASIHNGPGHRRFGQVAFPRSFVSLMARRDSENSATERPLTRDEQIKKEKKEKYDKIFGGWDDKVDIDAVFDNLEMNRKNKETTAALIELSKHDPNRFNMFHLNSRASTTGDNRDTHMHKLAAMFNHGTNKNKDSTENGQNKENSTDMLMNARASSSSKSDDIDFKLKLAEMLQNEAKSDDSGLKEKLLLSEEMKKLMEPEKKSTDDPLSLEALIALAKEKREEPKQETLTKETLKELLKELVPKPQEKSDDIDVKNELKELHKAIISLKQKEDASANNLDFNNFGNNRKGKQDDMQGNLKKLLKELQNRPQKKSDDLDVAIELKELQKAISSLRPKEQLQDNFDLNQFENNNLPKKPKQEEMQQFQSALSQLLAGGSLNTPSSSFDSAGSSSNIDLSALINNNNGNSLNNGPINVPSVIPNNVPQNPKLTPQQLIQLSKFMGTHNHNMGSGTSFNNLDGNTSPNLQQLLNSLNVPPNNMAASKSLSVNVNGGLPNQGRGFPNQGSAPIGGLGVLINGQASGSSGGSSPNKIDLNTFGVNSGSVSPKPNGFNINQMLNGGSHAMGSNANMYGAGFKGPVAYANYYPASNYGGNSYGLDNNNYEIQKYMGPYYSKPGYSDDYDLPHFVFPNLHTYGYDSSYTAPKKGYSAPSYASQGQGYGGKTDYGAPGYGSGHGGGNYQVPSNDYGANKGGYEGPGPEENEAAYQSFSKPFFLSPGPGQPGKYGGGYHGNKYGSKGYGGPSVDQSYGNGPNVDQYKNAMEADLAKQIEGLEGAITGLNKGDYSQNQEDKATVASLENRIHELKGVMGSLNKQPSYGPSQSYYAPSEVPYKQPPQYSTSHSSYKGGSHSHPYGSSSSHSYKHGSPTKQDHNTYSAYPGDQPSAPPAQPYSDTPPSYAPLNEPSYGPDQSHAEGAPSSYQSAEGDAHPGYPGGSTYQAKASARDRTITRGLRKVLDTLGASAKSRRRRSVQDRDVPQEVLGQPEVPRELAPPEREADMSFEIRQNHDGPEARHAGFDIGDDPLTHIANTFKKYLEDNLTEADLGSQPPNDQHQEGRASAMDGLREKLESLKKQLELPQPSKGSSSNTYGSHGLPQINQLRGPAYANHDSMDNHHYQNLGVPNLARPYVESKPDVYPQYPLAPVGPYAPYSYGNSYNSFPIGHQYQNHEVLSFDKGISDKKQDIFTKIVLKILEKILGALPDILKKLFGHVIMSIGDAHGDYYSPLQTMFKNLGAIGFIPLVLIRLIETQGTIIYYLSKNKFVRSFLIPLVAIIGAVLLVFFLVYFYQQDEPHGYIEYKGKNYDSKYPQYEAKPYNQNNYYRATDSGVSYQDPIMSNTHKPKIEPHYMKPMPYNTKGYGYNPNSSSKKIDVYNENYLDDSYNYKGHKNNDYVTDKKLDNHGGPSGYHRGYYDYFDNSLVDHHNRYEDEYL